MSKDFVLTTDELFGSYCYIEQKRYGVPNEKFLYKIIGKFTSNAWSNVPVDANDKEPHIFNHSEEVINVVCCGVCEDKIERYKLSDVEIISNKDQQLADLETKLAESEEEHELLIDQFEEETEKLRKQIKQESDARKRFVEEVKNLKQQLAEKDLAIDNWQTMYKSVVQTCYNDKEEIERLNKQLETQENTITNLVEDNRASQEWYKKQLEEKEKENTKLKEVVDCVDKLKQFNADMKDYALVNRDIADEIYCEHQDKISFAVEQLEKVKETAECVLDNALKNSSLNQSYYDRLLDEIDNQIKQLKEGK